MRKNITEMDRQEASIRNSFKAKMVNAVYKDLSSCLQSIESGTLTDAEKQKLEDYMRRPYRHVLSNALVVHLLMARFSPVGSKDQELGFKGILEELDKKYLKNHSDSRPAQVFADCVIGVLADKPGPMLNMLIQHCKELEGDKGVDSYSPPPFDPDNP